MSFRRSSTRQAFHSRRQVLEAQSRPDQSRPWIQTEVPSDPPAEDDESSKREGELDSNIGVTEPARGGVFHGSYRLILCETE